MVNLCAKSSLLVKNLHMITQKKIQATKKGGKTLPSTFEVSNQCLPATCHRSAPIKAIYEHTIVIYRCEKQTKNLRPPAFVKFTAKKLHHRDPRVNLDTCPKAGTALVQAGQKGGCAQQHSGRSTRRKPQTLQHRRCIDTFLLYLNL